MTLPSNELTTDNCVFLMIDHQVGLMQFLSFIAPPPQLKHNILGHAKTTRALEIPIVMGTSWPQGPNGPRMPELKANFPDVENIDRPMVNFWNDEASKQVVESGGLTNAACDGIPSSQNQRFAWGCLTSVRSSKIFI